MLFIFVCYNHEMPIDILIEGLLFYKSSPQKKRTVVKLLDITEDEFTSALDILKERLTAGATRVIETNEEIQLVTSPELAPIVDAMRKSELKADIGKAGAETLAIVLYREPISRAEIDSIRGVNSSFILRNLQIRGLVEKVQNKRKNSYEFVITPTLLSHLGVTHKHELPDFAKIADTLETFNADAEKQNV